MLGGIGAQNGFAVALREGDRLQARFAARRDMQADVARFRQRAAEIKDIDGLLKDRRTLQFVLEAFQMETEIDKRGILRKLMTEPPAATGSLANQFADPRYLKLAQAFGGRSNAPLGSAALVERLVGGAMTNRFEKSMGADNPGLREALYFRRVAGQATTIAQVMSDKALTEVARGALGLPDSFAALPFEQQRSTLTRRLDLAVLKDPKALETMARRYLALAAPQASSSDPTLGLFDGSGSAAGIAGLAGRRIAFSA
jgi:hypothetical protein